MPSQFLQNSRQIAITYGPDRARFKRVDVNETGTSTTYYVAGGGHEVVTSGTTVTHKTYIAGIAVVLETTSTPTSTQTIYLLKDHLGSTDVVTDSTGAVQTRYSFDAWGQRRDVTWAAFFPTVPTSLWQTALTTRGYTFHEQLDQVGLVHMNGRVYDPQLGRFLSADSFIQDPSNLQSLNRYSYVQNNPLSFTDPSGHFLSGLFKAIGNFISHAWHAITGAIKTLLKNQIVRAIIMIASCASGDPVGCAATAAELSLLSGGTPAQAFLSFATTFVTAGVWKFVGAFMQINAPAILAGLFNLGGGALQNAVAAASILVHGAVQGALTLMQGGSYLQGFANGAISEAATVGTRGQDFALRLGVVSAVGGLVSQLTGGKFANGAVSAAFAFIYNENGCGHGGNCGGGGAPQLIANPVSGGPNDPEWVIRWSLSAPSAQGGWIVQQVMVDTIFSPESPYKDRLFTYWEAWRIEPGQSTTADPDDKWAFKPLANSSATVTVRWPRLFGQSFRFDKWNVCRG
jgi:RHS repeat-associated protein